MKRQVNKDGDGSSHFLIMHLLVCDQKSRIKNKKERVAGSWLFEDDR